MRSPWPSTLAGAATYPWPNPALFTGVGFVRSQVRMTEITNGTSNTFMFGEKSEMPAHYLNTGADSDNENMYSGFNNDSTRTTLLPPQRDANNLANQPYRFGSAHWGGLNMAYCDGSVHFIGYEVDPQVFKQAGRRY